jgi:hypothetical protein
LREAGAEAAALARAIAVLGPGSELAQAAALARLDLSDAAHGADCLVRAHLLSTDKLLAFAHPLLAQAVYDEIPRHERALMHAHAARVLARAQVSPERVAAHLLEAPPAGDWWVVERLREAARAARQRAGGGGAVALLRRALAEPPSGELRRVVLLELGMAERDGDDRAAAEHLEQALAVTGEPRERRGA